LHFRRRGRMQVKVGKVPYRLRNAVSSRGSRLIVRMRLRSGRGTRGDIKRLDFVVSK
jgi:hypothetical protein